MKRNILLLILLIGFQSFSYSKIIRVNNMEESIPGENLYPNLEDAYKNSVSGDTIYIEGSNIPYGDLNIEKRLTLIGQGYFTNENLGISSNKFETVVNRITLSDGSSGSKIYGLKFNQTSSSGVIINVKNIEIGNCFFRRAIEVYENNIENIVITRNYFSIDGGFLYVGKVDPPQNFIFSNNIVVGNFSILDKSSGTITNNVFKGSIFTVGENANLQIHNNVFLGTKLSDYLMPEEGSNISHNISAIAPFSDGNNNQINVVEADVFITGDHSSDGKFQIREGGPADGKGKDGIDIGPFGGPKPYKLSGLPDIPTIYDFSTSGFGNADGKLPITIKVRAN
ncbi:hypothetical protein [Cyclobacterium amurskyense]|uniref:Right handed beta helix domain-containing protein n=1 Tax=Cyclobacterium amurskyense TaxID=320787 RepID=A0A0H4PFU9_9BACT|nr:hypothetical protein [Cyclobacterium amurskyense]AKP53094.1 hypothetical protein CA2015_3717 [Cyclobacterium amurskyense]